MFFKKIIKKTNQLYYLSNKKIKINNYKKNKIIFNIYWDKNYTKYFLIQKFY